ncbi:hypothetical protein C9I28_27405 [Pseudoduganella armeniaca]|uniref:Uncharacterized protein n=2 Tax=Pseudoduganella armeniaca TaxID=2072590 RepID=A0A2R4CH32_9BURK|nr:hypothetical protein C9I28_27405 [Pseudoduganella armeniaca]
MLAHLTGRVMHDSVDAARLALLARQLEPAASLLVVGLAADVDAKLLRSLAELSASHNVGVLVARSLDLLTQMIAWRLLHDGEQPPRGRHMMVLTDLAIAELFAAEDTVSQFGSGFVPPDPAERFDYFGFNGHGTAIHADLGSRHVLCGKRDDHPGSMEAPHLNACQASALCSGDGLGKKERIRLAQLQAKVYFVHTCIGITLGDPFHSPDLNLAMGALEQGALGYLSTMKVVKGKPYYPALVSCALRSGYSVGEAARLLTLVHGNACLEPPGHLLLGDPEFALAVRSDTPWQTSCRLDSANQTIDVQVRVQSDSVFALCEIPLDGVPQPGKPGFRLLALDTDGASAPFVELVQAKGKLSAVFLLPQPAPGAVLSLRISWAAEPYRQLLALARRIGANAVALRTIASYVAQQNASEALPGRVAFERSLGRLIATADAVQAPLCAVVQGFSSGNSLALQQQAFTRYELDEILQRLRAVEQAEIAQASEWRFNDYFPSLTEPGFIAEEETHTDRPCPVCGQGTDLVHRRSLYHPDVCRQSWHCQRCQQVLDRPAEGLDLRIACPRTGQRGEPVTITVMAENTHDWPVAASGAWRVHNKEGGTPFHRAPIAPLHIDLAPRERRTLELTLPTGHDAMIGHHRITLVYLSELGIAAANCAIHIGPGAQAAVKPVLVRRPLRRLG